MERKKPVVGLVIIPNGFFGGAQKRYTALYKYLYLSSPESYYFFVSKVLFDQIKEIFYDFPLSNVFIIDETPRSRSREIFSSKDAIIKTIFNPDAEFNSISLLHKCWRYFKNRHSNYKMFKKIETFRVLFKIDVFMGVYNGIIPLYFYLNRRKRPVSIIFSNMDSLFSEVVPDSKKFWYRKYYSFNYGMERANITDFLSPFILNGVKDRGVNIQTKQISIASCSFTDYSHCHVGDKKEFIISFAARMQMDKNPLLFVQAASEVIRKYPFVKFTMLGDGDIKDLIKSNIDKLGLSSKITLGFHPEPTMIFSETSIFCSIQSTNNYPSQSLLEAMACGNAIIATDVGDTRMLVNKTNGILIPFSLTHLIDAISYLIEHRDVTLQLGLEARKQVLQNHTLEKHASYYESLFKRALEEK